MRRTRAAKRAPVSAGQRIIEGVKEAIAGNLVRLTIDGQVWERKWPAMKRDQRIRRIMSRHTQLRDIGDGQYHVRLAVDHQSFTLNEFPADKQHANWYRKQLAIALNRFKHGD